MRYTPRVKYRKSYVCNSPCNFVIYLTKSGNRCKKIMQKQTFFLERISLSIPIDTFFRNLCATNRLRLLLSLYKYYVFQDHRNRDEQEHRTSDKIASKELKNQKRVDSLDPLQKNNNSENPSDFWEACRNRCTRRRMTRNHCLGNGKPHQLVHNTPNGRRIGGRWNSKVACYTRFGLGEGNDDVSSHCRSSRPRYD